ncbi:MAG: hypothetical protein OXU29_04810 [Gammaproteobacteria bacterium]|nr:hypothetical protein [Gammaproteobacteria bacterium]
MIKNDQIEIIIHKKLRHSATCRAAIEHYKEKILSEKLIGKFQNLDKFIRENILKQGSADFDVPYDNENNTYKVEAYVNYYMLMHYSANVAVFKNLTDIFDNITKSQRILFVDYGCGPMTSGLALLRRLDKLRAKEDVAYRGIDKSARMLEKAGQINMDCGFFSDAEFFSSIDCAVANAKEVVSSDCVVIVNFSYVLSPSTHRGGVDNLINAIINLANATIGAKSCMYVVYSNPSVHSFHHNWHVVRAKFAEKFTYNEIGESPISYEFEYIKRTAFYSAAQLTSKT